MARSVATFAFALLLLSPLAFWPMYLSKNWSAIDRYTHAHAVFGTLWLIILVVQPLLLLRGQRLAHRITGRAALFVAFGFVVSGVLLTHFRFSRMTEERFAQEGIYAYLPISVVSLFAVACILGIRWRHSPAVHARFMASTALLLLDPVLARIMYFHLPPLPSEYLYQVITFSVIATAMAFLVKSMPATVNGRLWYRNYCVGAVATLALFFAVPRSAAWPSVVRWFCNLPLT